MRLYAIISLFLVLVSCTPVRYLTSDEKVFRIPANSKIELPDKSSFYTPWDGYLLSDGQLILLYRAAKEGTDNGY